MRPERSFGDQQSPSAASLVLGAEFLGSLASGILLEIAQFQQLGISYGFLLSVCVCCELLFLNQAMFGVPEIRFPLSPSFCSSPLQLQPKFILFFSCCCLVKLAPVAYIPASAWLRGVSPNV